MRIMLACGVRRTEGRPISGHGLSSKFLIIAMALENHSQLRSSSLAAPLQRIQRSVSLSLSPSSLYVVPSLVAFESGLTQNGMNQAPKVTEPPERQPRLKDILTSKVLRTSLQLILSRPPCHLRPVLENVLSHFLRHFPRRVLQHRNSSPLKPPQHCHQLCCWSSAVGAATVGCASPCRLHESRHGEERKLVTTAMGRNAWHCRRHSDP